jgi:hypothetical protein
MNVDSTFHAHPAVVLGTADYTLVLYKAVRNQKLIGIYILTLIRWRSASGRFAVEFETIR